MPPAKHTRAATAQARPSPAVFAAKFEPFSGTTAFGRRGSIAPSACRTPFVMPLPARTRRSAWVSLALLCGVACGEDPPLTTPVQFGRRALHPDARGAIRRCKHALDTMFALPLDAQLPSALQACAELYVEPTCRSALARLDEVPPSARTRSLAATCRHAYCDELPSPRPELCSAEAGDSLESMDPALLRSLWRRFNAAVFLRDLATRDPLEGLAFRYLETEPQPSRNRRTTPRPEPVRLTFERIGPTHVLSVARPDGQRSRAQLPGAFQPADVVAVLIQDFELRPGTPLSLSIAVNATSDAAGSVLRGAADAGFDHLTMLAP